MTTINKNFFIAPSTTGLGAMRWVAALLLALMLTATTGWAAEVLHGGTESAPVAITTTAEIIASKFGTSVGYFVVNENTTITHRVRVGYSSNSNIYISIPTGKTLTVEVTGSDPGLRYWTESCALHVYGGGTLVVSNGIETYGGTCDMHNITINGAHYDDDGYLDGSIHTVTFNSKGGTAVASQTFGLKYGQTIATVTEPTAPTRTNYDFGGWYKESSCTNAWDFASDGVTADVTLYAKWTPDPAQFSQDGDTYTIKTTEGWNVFCDLLAENDKGYFSGKTVRLGADITVTRMAGGDNHEFTGTFDGGGKTLTVNYANTGNNTMTAPFSYVDGATIQNLIVGGTISGTAYRAAGIIGETVNTTSHITNCVSNVDISSGRYTGGFSIGGNVEIEGCVFNGKINGTDRSGGFIGYSYSAQVIKNSLFAPQDGSTISGGTFYFNGGGDVAPVNSYYTQALGTAQGKACHSVTAGADVTIDAIALTGTPTQYTVSGITAYSGGGLQRGQTLYYGSGDQLSLTLSNSATPAPQGYQYAYTASAGTLSGTTLTMPDEDVTISAALAPIDWATVNQGNSADPYMIYNKDQLLLLAHRVNGTSGETANDYEGKYFKLGADIAFTHDAEEGDDYAENYEAIGGYIGGTYRYFNGKFDGDGYTVSGIRIRKTGSGAANSNQGLFGRIDSGADIHDVHLTDARIIGYLNVGGIAGYNDEGYISGCSVTDSYITATSNYYGTICGRNNYTYRLTNNYYHGCTVNGTAVTSGKGCQGADLTANHGALPAYRLALGANITTPPGTFAGQTGWLDTPPVSPRLAPENGFTLAGNHYFASGYVFTPGSTLASGAAQGYTPRATLDGQLLDLYTPTDDADLLAGTAIARLTITADCDGKTLDATLRSTGESVTVAYIKADGTTRTAKAIALDGHETVDSYGSVSLAGGTYYVGTDIAYANRIMPDGAVTLILADGKTMTLNGNTEGIDGYNLTIYGQSLAAATAGTLRYNGKSDGIHAYYYEQHSGNVSITTTASGVSGIIAADVTLRGGTLTVSANGDNARAINGTTHSILGGQLTATGAGTGILAYANDGTALTLDWTRPDDRITASSISTGGGTVAVADGKTLWNGSETLSGTITDLTKVNGKTLMGVDILLDDDRDADVKNSQHIAALDGQQANVVLNGRTLYKDGSWNTLCLPFSVDLNATDCPLYGATARTVTAASVSGTTLNLTFGNAVNTLEAGTPYIIKWDGDGTSNIENPVFEAVTIETTKNDYDTNAKSVTTDERVRFVGTYKSTEFASEDKSILLMGEENTLYYPAEGAGVGSFRAYFKIGDEGALFARRLTSFSIDFGEGEEEATGIVEVEANTSLSTLQSSLKDAWHTLDGRRLQGKPTQGGIYIKNGKKITVK